MHVCIKMKLDLSIYKKFWALRCYEPEKKKKKKNNTHTQIHCYTNTNENGIYWIGTKKDPTKSNGIKHQKET